jgi:hypothetical protein
MAMRLRPVVLAVLVLVGALTGCVDPVAPVLPATPPIDEGPLLQQQAADALKRWDEAVAAAGGLTGFVPVSDPMTIVGTFEPAIADNAKLALTAGMFEIGVPPVMIIPAGRVVWADGMTRPVRTLSVAEAVMGLSMRDLNQPPCGCTPLRIVSAQPITLQVETTRGPALAPAWEFTLAGTAVKLLYVAVAETAGVQVTPPPEGAGPPPVGIVIWLAAVSPDGRRLRVFFTGSQGPGSVYCGHDYTGEAVESTTAVVVIVRAHSSATEPPNADGVPVVCPNSGHDRETTVDLAAPLDDRAVLEVVTGTPVVVRLT